MSPRAWLKPARDSRRTTGKPWRPPSLPSNVDVAKLDYIVVEERVDKVIGLQIAPWPRATKESHLHFPNTPAQVEVAAELGDLQRFLNENRRTPSVRDAARSRALRTRPVALGDVFGAVVDREALAQGEETEAVRAVAEWLKKPVYDVTGDAREAARTTFFDAVSDPLPPKVERQMVRKIRKDSRRGSASP
jgi:hypothetical protein